MRNVVYEKSFRFSVRIIGIYKSMVVEKREYVLSKQLLRCGTSIGANIAESQQAQSNADFVSKLCISLKEASETSYWLQLLNTTGYLSDSDFSAAYQDCRELERLLTAIIKTAKTKK